MRHPPGRLATLFSFSPRHTASTPTVAPATASTNHQRLNTSPTSTSTAATIGSNTTNPTHPHDCPGQSIAGPKHAPTSYRIPTFSIPIASICHTSAWIFTTSTRHHCLTSTATTFPATTTQQSPPPPQEPTQVRPSPQRTPPPPPPTSPSPPLQTSQHRLQHPLTHPALRHPAVAHHHNPLIYALTPNTPTQTPLNFPPQPSSVAQSTVGDLHPTFTPLHLQTKSWNGSNSTPPNSTIPTDHNTSTLPISSPG